ncbi:heavy-metal-associated domain-containing protein [Falsigemmobacter faecalis]|uniref:Heavy metal transport/detoxification protein n=1 Tax=Falsigemmobacter faecalis TaxID=2488730 RepID=A0A3P3DME1_9RHOB|nr:cation transporter [Falsigemmobacter faecalis]RRH74772.1 heavy metal transport/detoxification protein [Falsigemmobacter faecalis]
MSLQLTLHLPDMSCGHCATAVTQALKALDAAALVAVDLTQRRVTVTTSASEQAVIAGLDGIGFEARPAV